MSEPGGGGGGRRRGGSVNRARSCGRRKRRKNKVRSTPFPTRLHHHNPLQKGSGENRARSPSPGPGEPQPARAAQYRQLRREVLKTRSKSDKKIVKAEKNNSSHSPAAHRCEQRVLHKQKAKSNIQSLKNTSLKKTERLYTDSELTSRSVQKAEKKPLTSAENVQDIKIKEGYNREEIEKINYAGAKFSDPPSPSVLPKPPSHWMGINGHNSDQCKEIMTHHLKALLKVQL
ncbi:proline-rich nuclear receptor coactivator 1 [Hyla sarda]|uniref:proline-rich nuclear receptor coactivator 1 n=1 Tax=Hyla sarda TaxID=327740 RepID=UPI0024C3B7B8|nr:proline-rich nuclear receptor coactivator 1 [Hyla sarda]